jgi:predicted DNA-binding transcriptional regulator AlpA
MPFPGVYVRCMSEKTSDLELIRESELRHIVKLSHATIWRLCRAGKFPKAVKLSQRAIAWRLVDIERWLAECTGQSVHDVTAEHRQSAVRARRDA